LRRIDSGFEPQIEPGDGAIGTGGELCDGEVPALGGFSCGDRAEVCDRWRYQSRYGGGGAIGLVLPGGRWAERAIGGCIL